MAYNPQNINGQALSANSEPVVLSTEQQAILTSIKTAVEVIDNFISGTKGLVTEDNSSAIKTAVETIDNFISGARGLVTEDNSAAILTAASAIKAAAEIIDNFISGSRGLVTEDNSSAIKTAVEKIDDFISGARGLVTEDNSAAILTSTGAVADAIVAAGGTGSLSAKLRRVTQGLEDLKTGIILAAGSAAIGTVGVTSVPADPFGVNADAAILAGATGSMQAKFRLMTSQLDFIKTAVETIDNFISGTKGLVTEDSAVAIKNAVETIDNIVSGAGINQTQVAGTNLDVNSGNKSAGSQRIVIATDDINLAAINLAAAAIKTAVELIDNAVSGAGFNITQMGGTNLDMNSGNKSAGSLRVVVATDDINLSAIKTAVELIDNAVSGLGFNITQVAGTNMAVNSGALSAGVQRMAIATDDVNMSAINSNLAIKATYRASTTAVLVPAVTSPNPFFTIYGSGTKTVKVHKITISGLTLTAVAYLNIGLRKYSTAVSGGTSTALTKMPMDSSSAASTATNINAYTAIPTAGTTVGDLMSRRVIGQATTTAAAGIPQIFDLDFNAVSGGKGPIVLRGTGEGIGLYWITAPASTVSMLVDIEYTEE